MHKTAVYKTIAYGTPKTAKLRKSDITQQPVPVAYIMDYVADIYSRVPGSA